MSAHLSSPSATLKLCHPSVAHQKFSTVDELMLGPADQAGRPCLHDRTWRAAESSVLAAIYGYRLTRPRIIVGQMSGASTYGRLDMTSTPCSRRTGAHPSGSIVAARWSMGTGFLRGRLRLG